MSAEGVAGKCVYNRVRRNAFLFLFSLHASAYAPALATRSRPRHWSRPVSYVPTRCTPWSPITFLGTIDCAHRIFSIFSFFLPPGSARNAPGRDVQLFSAAGSTATASRSYSRSAIRVTNRTIQCNMTRKIQELILMVDLKT